MFRGKVPERPAGWVAEYCVICRDVQPMQLVHLGTGQTRRELQKAGNSGSIVVCQACGLRSQADPATYLSIIAARPEAIADLMKKTQPRLPLRVGGRVQWERRAIGGELAEPERLEALREPFLVLSYLLRQPVSGELAPLTVLLFAVVSLVSGFIYMLIASAFVSNLGDFFPIAFSMAVMTGVGAAIVANRRLFRRKDREAYSREIEPRLARALRPLRPTPDELHEVHAWMAAAMHPMAPLVDVDRLYEQIKATPDRSLTNADAMDLLAQAEAMYRELNSEPDSGDTERSVN
jgi:hypothetical protein